MPVCPAAVRTTSTIPHAVATIIVPASTSATGTAAPYEGPNSRSTHGASPA